MLVLLPLLLAARLVVSEPSLSLSIRGPETVENVDNLSVTTIITNTGDEELKLFNDPRTPLSTFSADTFGIASAAGQVPRFTGAFVKYGFNAAMATGDPSRFTVLAPGESKEVVHDLALAYNFSDTGTGAYAIEAFNKFHYVTPSGGVETLYPTVARTHAVSLLGSLVPTKRDIRRRGSSAGRKLYQKRASFSSCSSEQEDAITAALPFAAAYVKEAIEYLSNITSATPRYTTWFGAYLDSRKDQVLSHYTNIQEGDPSTFTFDCSCTEDDTFAYVYAEEFGYMYFCGAFWSAPTNGTDSKAGTIVHESSHYTKNGGTQDHAYGQTAAKSLARTSPAKAILNADSHEYFVENTPTLL